ncbi:MAG: ABC transporter permease [Synergistaceae bacterium]|nr:ABC transporter permease [Synergistaceae bacterium]
MHNLSTWGFAKKNLSRHPYRTFFLILAIMLLSFFLFTGSILSLSLSRGAASMSDRLGADVMVVPEGYDPHVDSILLSGKPSTFYLPDTALQEISAMREDIGIEQISPQTFLATLRASCCAYPVQLVGIDYDSDFIVGAWMRDKIHHVLRDGEIIVGYHVAGWPGDTIKFFGKSLTVAARLEQTGMGFDAMIFMNRATISELSREAERISGRIMRNDGSLTSVIMLKLKSGYDSVAAAAEINRRLNSKGIYALFSKKFVNDIGSSLRTVSLIIRGSVIFLWVMSVVIVGLIFALTLMERRSEFGILRSIGASRRKLAALSLAEVLMISVYGAALGVVLGNAAVAAGSPFVAEALGLPFLLPSLSVILGLTVSAVVLAVMTGVFSAGVSVLRVSRMDIHTIIKGA